MRRKGSALPAVAAARGAALPCRARQAEPARAAEGSVERVIRACSLLPWDRPPARAGARPSAWPGPPARGSTGRQRAGPKSSQERKVLGWCKPGCKRTARHSQPFEWRDLATRPCLNGTQEVAGLNPVAPTSQGQPGLWAPAGLSSLTANAARRAGQYQRRLRRRGFLRGGGAPPPAGPPARAGGAAPPRRGGRGWPRPGSPPRCRPALPARPAARWE